jgi:hypothetical protein
MHHREALDMNFIDHAVMPGDAWGAVAPPCEGGVDYHTFHHSGALSRRSNERSAFLCPMR